jgi:hypothetical protein
MDETIGQLQGILQGAGPVGYYYQVAPEVEECVPVLQRNIEAILSHPCEGDLRHAYFANFEPFKEQRPKFLHELHSLLSVVPSLAKPSQHWSSFPINVGHSWNLGISLGNIILIDAQRIYPENPVFVLQT